MTRNTCIYKISGTTTFRLSSSSILNKYGRNLQNIPKNIRQMYVPDDGKIFVQVDQAGAEALIVSYLCRKGNYRELFLRGIKPHTFVAIHVFAAKWRERGHKNIDALCATPIAELKSAPGWKELEADIKASDNWPASSRYYFIAKMIVHASSYGMKGNTFRLNVLEKSDGKIALSKLQADTYLEAFHMLFPEIREWQRAVERQLKESRILFTLQGYPRQFTGVLDDNDMKDGYAFVPQGTVGCITNIAYERLQTYIEDNNLAWDLLANTHDSYLCQCPIGEERECGRKMKEFIEQELVSPAGEVFNMRSEVVCGYNWNNYKKDSNPNGLKEISLYE